jgi:hypothetical protein
MKIDVELETIKRRSHSQLKRNLKENNSIQRSNRKGTHRHSGEPGTYRNCGEYCNEDFGM